MSDSDDSCGLSGESLLKAKNELGEMPETRTLEMENLRKRLKNVSGLKSRTDDQFLLRFLRYRKFDQEAAFKSILKFYQTRKDYNEIVGDLKPSRVKHLIDIQMFEVLEKRDNEGRRVIIWRAEKWDTERFPTMEYIKLLITIIMELSKEEETQVNGIHAICNVKNMSWRHLSAFTPSVAKAVINIAHSTIPLRFQRVDYVYEPAIFSTFFSVVKPFMKEKHLKRRFFNGDNMEAIYDTINPDYLPKDLGGKLEPFANKEWFNKLLDADKEFEEDNKYGYVSMKLDDGKTKKKEEDAELIGLGGTFKKLEV